MRNDVLRDIVRATCSGQPQRVKDYIYEELVRFYEPKHTVWKKEKTKR